ncbi:DUF1905 domain-containing protein [Nocardioides perillae]|uniref:DUF1905 domain-containing protein n=1 Tax=Nocardioides perillae TaxID=1119534 RepID=A0A7Y9RW56_9ACTN|nr:hypothetical protein [Nocardioides perillae]
MELQFSGPVFCWRGPAPHHFVAVPEDEAEELRETAAAVTYGWGMVPVAVRMGATTWTTSLWPKDGTYLVPLKLAARRAEQVAEGDVVDLRLTVDL